MTPSSSSYTPESVLERLQGKLRNLHRRGSQLEAACPECGGKDRFFSGPAVGYGFWSCRLCEYKASTQELAGGDGTFVAASRPRKHLVVDAVLISIFRKLYGSLAEYAQAALQHTRHAQKYLEKRGIDLRTAEQAGLGYLDQTLCKAWLRSLPPELKPYLTAAGLPITESEAYRYFEAMFAGGHLGKIVFPYKNGDGQVVDLRTRSISDNDTIGGERVRYTSPRGSVEARGALLPYGVDSLGSVGRLTLTEGEFKRLVPLAAGFKEPILALRGVSDPALNDVGLFRGRQVILAFDNDTLGESDAGKSQLAPGPSATVRIARYLRANQIEVLILDPVLLRDTKGIDDFVLKYGIEVFNSLLTAEHLLILREYENRLARRGVDLSRIKTPKGDPGTLRNWMPKSFVDDIRHGEQDVVSLEEASAQISVALTNHWQNWQPGAPQLLITTEAGTGKTTAAVETAIEYAADPRHGNEKQIAIFVPNHETIDEKIGDGTLPNFGYVYGHRNDKLPDGRDDPRGIQNCRHAESAVTLIQRGYRANQILCPSCHVRQWCQGQGYLSQFHGKGDRAYVHAHLFTDYPDTADLVVIDELTHKPFIADIEVGPGDIDNVLRNPLVSGAQRGLLEGLRSLFGLPDLQCISSQGGTQIESIGGREFYHLLERRFPSLSSVDAWHDGSAVEQALHMLAKEFADPRSVWRIEQLTPMYAPILFKLLAEDVQRLNDGQPPTGRVQLVRHTTGERAIKLTYCRDKLPEWTKTRPVAILNATGDSYILNELIGPLQVIAPQVALQDGNEIIQDVRWNHAYSSLVGESVNAKARRATWLDRIRSHVSDESDTTIITTKVLANHVRQAFPHARVAYYGALEGRNDLQSGTTILANSPPINLPAVQLEAAALWPGVDTTLTRRSVAFDHTNERGVYLAVEQIDAVDPRVQALLWQHRDAAIVQAAHRSRVIRRTGCKIVLLFARPAVGLRPTQIIWESPERECHARGRKKNTIEPMVAVAQEMAAKLGCFALSDLAEAGPFNRATIWKNWPKIMKRAHLVSFKHTVNQPLAKGGWKRVEMIFAFSKSALAEVRMYDVSPGYYSHLIADGNVVQSNLPMTISLLRLMSPRLPHGWVLPEQHLLVTVPLVQPRAAEQAQPKPDALLQRLKAQADINARPFLELERLLRRAARGVVMTQGQAQEVVRLANELNVRSLVPITAKGIDLGQPNYGDKRWTIGCAAELLPNLRYINGNRLLGDVLVTSRTSRARLEI